jgi:hypothetical protein
VRGDDDSRAGQAFETGNPPRLTEESGVDPWLLGLVRSTGPYKSPPGRKQRVLLSLGRAHVPRRGPLILRPAIVAGVLIGCGAFASAALGPWRGWVGRAYERLVPSTERVAETPARARTHRLVAGHAGVVAGHAGAVATQVSAAAPPAESAPPLASGPPSALPPSASPPSGTTLHVRHAAPLSSARQEVRGREEARDHDMQEQETQIVLAGMRALRVDHDPAHARGLLARYLERRPNGALAEEALALTIEAAVAHHDSDAAALGARYLRRYPAGPFRALALQAQR